jgi:thiamine-monophosphate kinase
MLSEFALIERFFAQRARADAHAHHAAPGIGDDCALLAPHAGQTLAISTDMLVAGRHFLPDADPHALGHKALAVNLSDLAAMGASPVGFTLALALPEVSEAWLDAFSNGLFELAECFDCELIGGDTTAGPLNICITVFGSVPPALALRRDAAQPGDDVWVSGTLGDARAGLGVLRGEWCAASNHATDAIPVINSTSAQNDATTFIHALERPQPRVALGLALRGIAHAAIDLSDGLAGDLAHILERSQVNAQINVDALPRSAALARLPLGIQRQCTLAGGDDYELCFTAAPMQRAAIEAAASLVGVPVTRIGTITPSGTDISSAPGAPGITWHNAAGTLLDLTPQGFDHFTHHS